MKEVIAVVRMNMMNKTKQALTEAGIDAFFAHEAQGRGYGFVNRKLMEGTQEGYEEAASLLGEKGKLYPIIDANQTGKPGDGKIFVLPLGDAVRVRTGEQGVTSIS